MATRRVLGGNRPPYGPSYSQYSLVALGGVAVAAISLVFLGGLIGAWWVAATISVVNVGLFGSPIVALAVAGRHTTVRVDLNVLVCTNRLFLREPLCIALDHVEAVVFNDEAQRVVRESAGRVRGFTLFGEANTAVTLRRNANLTIKARRWPIWDPLVLTSSTYLTRPPRYLRPRHLVLALGGQTQSEVVDWFRNGGPCRA